LWSIESQAICKHRFRKLYLYSRGSLKFSSITSKWKGVCAHSLILNLFHNKISQEMSEMIDVVVDEDRIKVYNVCRQQLGSIWSDVPQSQLIIKRFS
jgi:hypothetical protein